MQRDWMQQPGFALLQVMVIVGVAAVLGFALLAETSLQVQVSSNAALAARADTLVESGVNLATYYLLNPWNAPSLQNGYWPGGTNISLGGTVTGTIDVTVAKDLAKTNEYVITSSGKTGGSSGSGVTHTAQVRVRIEPGLKINRAVSCVKPLSVSSFVSIIGNVATNGQLTLMPSSTINGTAYAGSFDNKGAISNTASIASTDPAAAPTTSSIQMYQNYVHTDGQLYPRSTLSAAPSFAIGGGVMDQLGPTTTPANPAGVYYYNNTLTLNNNLKLNGTLIVTGNVILNGTNIEITAQDGYPALIVLGEFRTRPGKSIKIAGATFIGKTIKPDSGTSIGTSLTFNGAVLFGDNGAIAANSGAVTIDITKVSASKLNLPDLDTSNVRSVTVLSWK